MAELYLHGIVSDECMLTRCCIHNSTESISDLHTDTYNETKLTTLITTLCDDNYQIKKLRVGEVRSIAQVTQVEYCTVHPKSRLLITCFFIFPYRLIQAMKRCR